jgi:pimeloyl-ACP methyl ester carboxylesterase
MRLDGQSVLPPDVVPVGRILPLADRGETFFRHHTGGEPGAPTVLLLHGWTATADLQFATAYEQLGRTYPFVAIDHRGHGRGIRDVRPFTVEDAADDAAALIVALGLSPVVALGYSMGGPIALALARRHPHLVAGLVLQATTMSFHRERFDRVRWAFVSFLETLLRSRGATKLGELGLGQALKHNPELRPWGGWLAGELRRAEPISLAEAGRALRAFDGSFAAELDVPAGVLVTTKDQLVAPSHQRALAAALRADVVELAGDHFCTWMKGAEYADATCRLVDQVVARIAAANRAAVDLAAARPA